LLLFYYDNQVDVAAATPSVQSLLANEDAGEDDAAPLMMAPREEQFCDHSKLKMMMTMEYLIWNQE